MFWGGGGRGPDKHLIVFKEIKDSASLLNILEIIKHNGNVKINFAFLLERGQEEKSLAFGTVALLKKHGGPLLNVSLAGDISSLATNKGACMRTLFIQALLQFTNRNK